jgi:hypothetical protein
MHTHMHTHKCMLWIDRIKIMLPLTLIDERKPQLHKNRSFKTKYCVLIEWLAEPNKIKSLPESNSVMDYK